MFTDKDVEAKYRTDFKGSQVIHMPKYADKLPFRKKLKDLTLPEADALYNRGDGNNILQLKAPAENKPPKPQKADKDII